MADITCKWTVPKSFSDMTETWLMISDMMTLVQYLFIKKP